jgi:hypothetical protein
VRQILARLAAVFGSVTARRAARRYREHKRRTAVEALIKVVNHRLINFVGMLERI